MPTQEEIKVSINSYLEAKKFGLVNPHEHAAIIADAYIEEHDDTPITLDEAEKIAKNSCVTVSIGNEVIYADFDFGGVPIKTRSQLLALLKGLGE